MTHIHSVVPPKSTRQVESLVRVSWPLPHVVKKTLHWGSDHCHGTVSWSSFLKLKQKSGTPHRNPRSHVPTQISRVSHRTQITHPPITRIRWTRTGSRLLVPPKNRSGVICTQPADRDRGPGPGGETGFWFFLSQVSPAEIARSQEGMPNQATEDPINDTLDRFRETVDLTGPPPPPPAQQSHDLYNPLWRGVRN